MEKIVNHLPVLYTLGKRDDLLIELSWLYGGGQCLLSLFQGVLTPTVA